MPTADPLQFLVQTGTPGEYIFIPFHVVNDAAKIEELLTYRRNTANGISPNFVTHIMKKTKVGSTFVGPVIQQMEADRTYTAHELAALLGPGWTPKKISSKLCVLGRPEDKFKAKVFERCNGGYKIGAAMKEALLAA